MCVIQEFLFISVLFFSMQLFIYIYFFFFLINIFLGILTS